MHPNKLNSIITYYQLTGHIKSMLNDSAKPSTFTEVSNHTKQCIGLCLRLLYTFFAWSGFADSENKESLRRALFAICQIETNEIISIQDLASKALTDLIVHEIVILDLTAAVHMVHLIEVLVKLSESTDTQKIVVKMCKVFLMRRWFTFEGTQERGAQCNIQLDQLLRGLFREPTQKSYKQYLTNILDEISRLKGKDDTLVTFPCFYK